MSMHFGRLNAYGNGPPEVIEVNKPGLAVHFNVWFSKRSVSGSGKLITIVVPEAILVKGVGASVSVILKIFIY